MFGGTPRTSWCPCITSPAVVSCWKPLSPLMITLSVSWMVMVGYFQTCFDFCNHSPFGFGYFYCWSVIFFLPTVLMGSWFDHVREYYEARSALNIHYMKYEDMLKVGNLPFTNGWCVCLHPSIHPVSLPMVHSIYLKS